MLYSPLSRSIKRDRGPTQPASGIPLLGHRPPGDPDDPDASDSGDPIPSSCPTGTDRGSPTCLLAGPRGAETIATSPSAQYLTAAAAGDPDAGSGPCDDASSGVSFAPWANQHRAPVERAGEGAADAAPGGRPDGGAERQAQPAAVLDRGPSGDAGPRLAGPDGYRGPLADAGSRQDGAGRDPSFGSGEWPSHAPRSGRSSCGTGREQRTSGDGRNPTAEGDWTDQGGGGGRPGSEGRWREIDHVVASRPRAAAAGEGIPGPADGDRAADGPALLRSGGGGLHGLAEPLQERGLPELDRAAAGAAGVPGARGHRVRGGAGREDQQPHGREVD